MREIKFRAWDTTKKEMLQVRQILIPDGNNENGFQELAVSGLKFGTNPSHWRIAPPLMQYTGLKDKNGKEIYEGDILNTVSEPPFIIYEVTYIAPRFLLKNRFGTFPFSPMASERHYEVIGNIYENPDLLEGK